MDHLIFITQTRDGRITVYMEQIWGVRYFTPDHLACQWCWLTHVDSSPKHHSIGRTGQQFLVQRAWHCLTFGIYMYNKSNSW